MGATGLRGKGGIAGGDEAWRVEGLEALEAWRLGGLEAWGVL